MQTRALALPLLALVSAALAWACGSTPAQPINPETRIQSTSPDDMPPTGTSGLGTPGSQRDAGLPHLPTDGAIAPGSGHVP